MLHHVLRVCVEGETLTGARETLDTLLIVPSTTYRSGRHHQEAFVRARGVGLQPPYRIVRERAVLTDIQSPPSPRGRRNRTDP